jgi:hypothetical protein
LLERVATLRCSGKGKMRGKCAAKEVAPPLAFDQEFRDEGQPERREA